MLSLSSVSAVLIFLLFLLVLFFFDRFIFLFYPCSAKSAGITSRMLIVL